MKVALFCILTFSILFNDSKVFTKKYYDNGNKMSCGWLEGELKTGFWEFFYENGAVKSSGHFKNDLKNGYWYFYNQEGALIKEGHFTSDKPEKWWKYYKNEKFEKCIYQSDGKTRYCLIFINGKLKMGSKYVSDILVKEWNSITSFRKDNPNFSF